MTRNRKLRRPSVKKKTRRSKRNKKELAEKNKKGRGIVGTAIYVGQTTAILALLSPFISVIMYTVTQLMSIGANYAMLQAILWTKDVALRLAT